MDRGKTFLVALLATYVAASAAEPQPRGKGWMAHNMNGSCEIARGGVNLDPSDTTQGLLVQAIGNPRERSDRGQVMMNIAFFVGNKMAENSEVVSFSILDGAADFPVNRFATSKAMFETCVRESRKNND